MKRALAWMCLCLALAPAAAYAQASITGVVKDTSGAVLPGVTVEVASPALIEKVRTTVTDGSGPYQIIQLLPGTYTATFTLPGFSTTKREGIELSGSFVATRQRRTCGSASWRKPSPSPARRRSSTCGAPQVQKVVTQGDRRRDPDRPPGHQPRGAAARHHPRRRRRRGPGQHERADVAGRRRHGGRHLHRPVDPRRQAGRAAPDDRRPVGGDDHPLRRIAQQLAQLHRDAGDVGEHVRRRRVDGRRRRADQLRAARRRQHLQGPAVLLRRQRLHAGRPTTRPAPGTRPATARRPRACSAAA